MRVLVTGVSEGIGGAVARTVAETAGKDAAVALCVRTRRPFVEELAASLEAGGSRAIILEGDLADADVPARFVQATAEAFGGIDAVVSNAGAVDPAALESTTLESWDRMYAVTTRASWLLGKAAFPYLKESQGAFVAVSSQSGVHPHRMTGGYSSAKAALIMLARQMALEWGEHGIRVNAVSPGMTMTPMTRPIYADAEVARKREEIVPLHRIGAPEDVAAIIRFLISDENRYITGENILVDGGLTLTVLDRIPGLARSKASPSS